MAELTREERLQAAVNAASLERRAWWALGDVLATTIMAQVRYAGHGPRLVARARSAAYRDLAATLGLSTAQVKRRTQAALAFTGTDRHLDREPSWYEAVVQASRRAKRDPTAVLADALAHDWSVKDLKQQGRVRTGTPYRLRRRCPTCDTQVSVAVPEQAAPPHTVQCPQCVGAARTAGTDPREVDALGVPT